MSCINFEVNFLRRENICYNRGYSLCFLAMAQDPREPNEPTTGAEFEQQVNIPGLTQVELPDDRSDSIAEVIRELNIADSNLSAYKISSKYINRVKNDKLLIRLSGGVSSLDDNAEELVQGIRIYSGKLDDLGGSVIFYETPAELSTAKLTYYIAMPQKELIMNDERMGYKPFGIVYLGESTKEMGADLINKGIAVNYANSQGYDREGMLSQFIVPRDYSTNVMASLVIKVTDSDHVKLQADVPSIIRSIKRDLKQIKHE